jgi:hypothetical protein
MGNSVAHATEIASTSTLQISKEMEYDEIIRNYENELEILSKESERYITSSFFFKNPIFLSYSTQISCSNLNSIVTYDLPTKTAKFIYLPDNLERPDKNNERILFINETEFILYTHLRGKHIKLLRITENTKTHIPKLDKGKEFTFKNIEEYESELIVETYARNRILNMTQFKNKLYAHCINYCFEIFDLKTLQSEKIFKHGLSSNNALLSGNIFYFYRTFMSLEDELLCRTHHDIKHISSDGTKLITYDYKSGEGHIYDFQKYKINSECTPLTNFILDDVSIIKFSEDAKNIVLISCAPEPNSYNVSIISVESGLVLFRAPIRKKMEIRHLELIENFILISDSNYLLKKIMEIEVFKIPNKFKIYDFKKVEDIRFKFISQEDIIH